MCHVGSIDSDRRRCNLRIALHTHGDQSSLGKFLLESLLIIFELFAPDTFPTGAVAERDVTTLRHEARYYPVKWASCVVELLAARTTGTFCPSYQGQKVLAGQWGDVRPQLQHDALVSLKVHRQAQPSQTSRYYQGRMNARSCSNTESYNAVDSYLLELDRPT